MKQKFLLLATVLGFSLANAQNNVGINTNTPLAGLHVAERDVVFTSDGIVPVSPVDPPVSGAGRRMMWYPDKAAFRVGYVGSNQWDFINIGNYSFAGGNSSIARGSSSFAMGSAARATGNSSMSLGENTIAAGTISFASGQATRANGFTSTAMGQGSRAEGTASFSMGYFNIANAAYSFVVGHYNDTALGETPNMYLSSDRVFQIGNGANEFNRKNAVTVLRNGNTGIGTATPTSLLEVNGKTQTDQLQVGTGSTISNLQFGTHIAGASANSILVTTITFPSAFAAAPKVNATIRHDPAWNVNDTFVVNVKSVSNTQAVLLIRRVDTNAPWSQNLLVDYIAMQ